MPSESSTNGARPTAHMGEAVRRTPARSVLIVEDDAAIRDSLGEALQVMGYSASFCGHGREALEYLRRARHPDVILLDLMLPVMDGWEFRIEQRKDPALAAIPVVALSADGAPKAAAVDADAYLKKPVDFDTLANAVERVVLLRENRLLQARIVEADRAMSLATLAAGVAHEINNPLSYVMLNLSFVRGELNPPLPRVDGNPLDALARDARRRESLLDALKHAQDGAERIRTIVRGLSTFSGPEDDSLALVNVRTPLESTLAMLEHAIRSRARLVTEYDDAPCVRANEARLAQVFLNLLINAEQSLTVSAYNEILVRLRNVPPNVVVEVRDTGCGIPDDVRGRIFEPFFTTKAVGIGTGLGLSICHGIVRSLGGVISFETAVGRGSVFRVLLPAAQNSGA